MTAQTLTLSQFLLDRIAEDEAAARKASHQKVGGPSHGEWHPDSALLSSGSLLERVDRVHIARWDPARVLAECAAKRQIVEQRVRSDRNASDSEWAMGYSDANYEALTALASVYADHELYRAEWAL